MHDVVVSSSGLPAGTADACLFGLSLCSGAGGLDLGLTLALPGYRTVGYVERDAFAATILVARMEDATLDHAPLWDEIGTFGGRTWRGAVDIVTAGYARNARTHSADLVAQIAATIAEFGFTNPMLIGADGVIIAGHGRLMAARQLGPAEVPVIRLAHLSEVQRRALVIADNRIAENAGWDGELLRSELAALQGLDFDLDLVGFSDDELADLLGDAEASGFGTEPDDEEDEIPEPPEDPITRPGDIWILGDHRLMCGDSTDAAAVAALMGDERATLLFTSPPYG